MSKTCPEGLSPNGLEWCDGRQNTPGVRPKILVIGKKSILTWPVLPDPETESDPVKLATYIGNFVLAADKYWEEVDIDSDKSPISGDAQGEYPSVTTLVKASFKHHGVEEEASAFARKANNSDYVYLVQQRNGKWRVVGNEMYRTKTKVAQKLGDASGSEMGTTIEVEVTDVMPAPFYVGEILTKKGIENASEEASINLTSAKNTQAQTVAANAAIVAITYYYTGTLGAIVWTAAKPAGITVDTTEDGIVRISGTPTAAGNASFEIPVTGTNGVSVKATGSITVQ